MEVLQKQSIVDLATSSIIDFICSGSFKKGDKLPTEMEMTKTLGISRSALRESYRRLQEKGYLSISNGKGAFVRSTDKALDTNPLSWFKEHDAQMRDYLQVRLSIDPLAARLAARKKTVADIEKLREIQADFEKAYAVKDNERMAIDDAAFHEEIAAISRNELLRALVKIINTYCAPLRGRSLRLEDHSSHAIGPHRRILEAIARGDGDAAAQESTDHMRCAYKDICGEDI